jgi:hypothetical protein
MDNKKDIGEVYKDQYSNLELEPDKAIWDSIESKNKKMKFYRFIWNQFNIYYLIAIILFFVIFIFSFVKVISFNNAQSPISPVYIPQDSVTNDFSLSSEEPMSRDKEKFIPKGKEEGPSLPLNKNESGKIVPAKNTKLDSLNKNANQNLSKDSLKNIVVIDTLSKLAPPPTVKKEPKRRVVILEQRDTIIQVDTLKSRVKRKRQ